MDFAKDFPEKRLAQQCTNCGAAIPIAAGLCASCYKYQKIHHQPRPLLKTRKGRDPVPPRPCRNCGRLAKPLPKGLCYACYEHERRTGHPRTLTLPAPLPLPSADEYFLAALQSGEMPQRAPAVGPPGPRLKEVQVLLETLLPRHREVIVLRFGLDGRGGRTQRDVAAHLGVTYQRIAQIQEHAIAFLRTALIQHPELHGSALEGREGSPLAPQSAQGVADIVQALAEQVRQARAATAAQRVPTALTWRAGIEVGQQTGKMAAYAHVLSLLDRAFGSLAWRTPTDHKP